MLQSWLVAASEPVAVIIDLMALVIVAIGSLHAFIAALHLFVGQLRGQVIAGRARRALWLTYGRWLVAALTFQLAADIVQSSVAPSWQEIGMLAAVALIRTFLNYFLERDIDQVRERDRHRSAAAVLSEPSAEKSS
ncbi:MAG TPA: DUF1622 domain-containing protein [Stenotrophomonas sp.]|nr:DUF1622 domain-containing protein [Stenotrophomonas sp.]